MNLSNLQKFILKQVYLNGGDDYHKDGLINFYPEKADQEDRVGTITRSIERMIDRGLISAVGHKTQHKLFIESIFLTDKGAREAQRIIQEKQKLPF